MRVIENVNEARFWSKVDRSGPVPEARPELGPCWIWTAAVSQPDGYGRVGVGDRVMLAHRVSYTISVGPIPAQRQLDHLCRRRECVNPGHLEPVTHQENVARGEAGAVKAAMQAAKTHCPQGHRYDEQNTYVARRKNRAPDRQCRKCRAAAARRYQQRGK